MNVDVPAGFNDVFRFGGTSVGPGVVIHLRRHSDGKEFTGTVEVDGTLTIQETV